MEQRCNEVVNCDDGSDESDCSMLKYDLKQYRKNYPPVLTENSKVCKKMNQIIY
jgi:hypothetical protein